MPAAVFSESEFAECAFVVNFPFPRVLKVLSVVVAGSDFLFSTGAI